MEVQFLTGVFLNQIVVQLIIEGGTAIAIFIRCFTDKKGIERELERRLHVEFPRGVLATISVIYSLCYVQWVIIFTFFLILGIHWLLLVTMLQVLLVLMTAYSSAAMGQLFFFHVVLIRKVIIMVC
jgi:palmitoyltransferase